MPKEKTKERSIVDIDLGNLHTEWQNQPKLYLDAGEKLADARKAHEQAKIELSIVTAEADLAIRKDPEKFGLEKATDASVKAAVPNHKKVRRATEVVLEARHDVDMLEALCRSLEHRKRALEKAVDLHLAGYFGEPRTSGSKKEALADRARRKIRGVRGNDDDDDD